MDLDGAARLLLAAAAMGSAAAEIIRAWNGRGRDREPDRSDGGTIGGAESAQK